MMLFFAVFIRLAITLTPQGRGHGYCNLVSFICVHNLKTIHWIRTIFLHKVALAGGVSHSSAFLKHVLDQDSRTFEGYFNSITSRIQITWGSYFKKKVRCIPGSVLKYDPDLYWDSRYFYWDFSLILGAGSPGFVFPKALLV